MHKKTNKFSRLTAIILTAAMLISMLPLGALSAFAAGTKPFTVKATAGVSPLQGADVKITSQDTEIDTKQTDTDGSALFSLSEDAVYQYEVSKLGYQTVTGSVDLDAGSVEVTLTEKKKVAVSGQVLDQDEAPLLGASVGLSGYGEEKSTTTTDDGAFSFSDVYAGETYTLTATLATYKTTSISVSVTESDSVGNTIKMPKKDTEVLTFESDILTVKYGQTVTNTATAPSGAADHYESLAPEVAQVDDSGKITPVSVGQAEIKATKYESENYLQSEDTYWLTVELGEQAELRWEKSIPTNLTWTDTFTNTVTGGSGSGDVTYGTDDTDVAEVNSDTGEVTFKKPGTAKITATKAADPFYKAKTVDYPITVGKAKQAPLAFRDPRPDAICYGDSFTNTATGGSVDGQVTYEVDDDSVAEVDGEGTITTKKSGTIRVTATLTGNALYQDVSAEYQLQINKAEQKNEFRFVKGDSPITIKYGEELSNPAFGGENAPITYESSVPSVATVDADGKITTLKKGTTIITATNPEDDRFNKKEIKYTLIVEQADQGVTFDTASSEIPAITYGDKFQNEAHANTKITYSSSASDVADVDDNGNLIIHKAGTVTITATAAETEQYKSAEESYTITIERAEQTITFKKGSLDPESGAIVVETTFNAEDNHFSNPAVSKQQGEEIEAVYTVSSGASLVGEDFDKRTGTFTILGAGTIVISVAVDSNECYLPGVASYTLKVAKAKQTIAFPQTEYTLVSGHDFTSETMPKATATGELFGTGDITYSYENDENNVVKTLSDDGNLVLTYRTGTVTVKATKAEDANYEQATATYLLTVKPWEPSDTFYKFTGSKTTPENEWFTGNVALAANEGYYISYQNDRDAADWQQTLSDVVTADGESNEVSFYLKNEAGDISALITQTVKKDETLPTVSVDTEAPSILVKLLEIISFGAWKQDTVSYTAETNDETSGVVSTEYHIVTGTTEKWDKEQLDAISDWTAYTGAIPVSKDQMYVVYLKVTDAAGNYSYNSTEGTIFDATEPTIHLSPSTEGNIYADGYYTGDVNFDLSVSDPAPSAGIKSVDYVVTVNKEEKVSGNLYTFDAETEAELPSEWSKDSPLVVPSEDVSDTDEILLKVTVEDLSGNVSTEEVPLKIISQPAVVTVTKIEDGYYQDPQTSTITVSGRANSFNQDNITIQVTAQDAAGKNVAEPGYVLSDWNKGDNGDYTATITFNGDANYSAFSVTYQDSGEKGLKGECNTEFIFTVDKTRPTGSITVAENIWQELIEKLTFGLWGNKPVTVTATAEDKICAPAPKIEYFKTSDTSLKLRSELEEYKDWQEFHTFEVSSDEVFVVYLKITDAAGNYDFLSSNGYILDSEEADVEVVAKEKANENGYYNEDVPVLIDVKEKEDATYSGIKSIEYWVENNGQKTQGETLFTFETKDPTYEQLVSSWNSDEAKKEIVVSSEANNSDEVTVHVKVTDNAGNEKTAELALKIDITHPKIQLSYDVNNGNVYEIDGVERGYFKTNRTATVQITERTTTFNGEKATKGLVFSGVDANGEDVPLDDVKVSEWNTEEGKTPDEAVHTATVEFNTDANYTFSISYTDEAGNANDPVDVGQSMTPYHFTVDQNDPTAQVTVKDNTWDRLLDTLTFGLWSNETVTVTASANDVTSPFVIEYIKTDAATQKNAQELDAETSWAAFNELTINPDEQFVVYLRVTDYAGNDIYLNSDGHIVEKTAPKLTLTPDKTEILHNNVGVYNKDVNVLIQAEDQAPYSGIQKVEYWVTCNGKETQRETLYLFEYVRDTGLSNNGGKLTVTENGQKTETEGTVPTQAELKASFAKTITVEANKNNSCDVDVYVGVTDNAGNYTEETVALDIDITAPTIQVSYDNNAVRKTVDERGYFPAGRTATVVITERNGHFSAEDATAGIAIKAVDAKGTAVLEDTRTLISTWITAEAENDENAATHTATIDCTADANYDFSISYTDLAKWTNEDVETGDSVSPYCFTVDQTKPTGTVTVEELGTWDKLIEILTFGLWSRDAVSVSGTSDDATSPIESVDYYKTSDIQAKTVKDLEKITGWTAFTGFDVSPNERFAVYVRIIDFAGNTMYISTDGIIVDDQLPIVEKVQPEITITPQQPINDIYNTDVTVAVKVYDPITGDDSVYSGLKEIRYEVLNLGAVTQEGVLYSFEVQKPTQPELLQLWEKEDAIVVEKELNNSNDVVVKVYAVDNAGNENENSVAIRIDTTAPYISVAYDNNDGDTSFTDGTYFKANRRATITVTERNFDPGKVNVTITNQHMVIPALSGWQTVVGTAPNGDDIKHIATILYDADGDYTFAISYSDQAGNANTPVNYGSSLAPTVFTIDKTMPTVNVAYDNNSAQNGNYYKAQRVATITVTEHNFETSRVVVKLTATDNSAPAASPTMSGWRTDGDVHTATITYAADSLYTFDFDYTDKAGNAAANIEEQRFYVDKTNPEVTIKKVVTGEDTANKRLDESANNNDGNIGFVITATDTNFDVFTPVLTVVDKNNNRTTLDIGAKSDIPNGKTYTVTNIDTDGIYTITCTVVDKAGNAYSEIHLEDQEGNPYVENRSGTDPLVIFSVNRDGSTFMLDQNTSDMVQQYYVQDVLNDVVVVEINADPLSEHHVTVNGKEVQEVSDYSVSQDGGSGSWLNYTYRINKSLFEAEGEYKVVVSSKDKAGNDAFSDVKDASIDFVVDRTAPVVTVTGLAENGIYKTDKQVATLVPTDDGGALKSLVVRLVELDKNGNATKTVKELVNLSGDELEKALESDSGKITFALTEGLYQNVQIICNDCAVDADGKTNTHEEIVENVSVSTNAFKVFWANKPLRWGSIAGVSVIALGIILLIVLKKRKKDKATEK